MVKRRIKNTLRKIQGTIEQYGRKSINRGYVKILEESLNEAEVLRADVWKYRPEVEKNKIFEKSPKNYVDSPRYSSNENINFSFIG